MVHPSQGWRYWILLGGKVIIGFTWGALIFELHLGEIEKKGKREWRGA
jgi:hypothetical protein